MLLRFLLLLGSLLLTDFLLLGSVLLGQGLGHVVHLLLDVILALASIQRFAEVVEVGVVKLRGLNREISSSVFNWYIWRLLWLLLGSGGSQGGVIGSDNGLSIVYLNLSSSWLDWSSLWDLHGLGGVTLLHEHRSKIVVGNHTLKLINLILEMAVLIHNHLLGHKLVHSFHVSYI